MRLEVIPYEPTIRLEQIQDCKEQFSLNYYNQN